MITNNLSYDTEQVSSIHRGLWQIEEGFRILETDLRARPVFVWNDAHLQGHFVRCFLCLHVIRHAQYLLLEKNGPGILPRETVEAIDNPSHLCRESVCDQLEKEVLISGKSLV